MILLNTRFPLISSLSTHSAQEGDMASRMEEEGEREREERREGRGEVTRRAQATTVLLSLQDHVIFSMAFGVYQTFLSIFPFGKSKRKVTKAITTPLNSQHP